MDNLITFNVSTDLSNLLFTPSYCGLIIGCMVALFGWVIGWFFSLLSKAF